MPSHTHTTFPTKKAAADHQKRVSSAAAEGKEEKHTMADRYKTKMCKNFLAKGECPYEVRCMFAHGERELRTSEENVRDGLVTDEAIKAYQRQHNQTKRRMASASNHVAGARVAATAVPTQQEVYVGGEENDEETYYNGHQHESVNALRFLPHAQPMPHSTGLYTHNPYRFNIIPVEAREFAMCEEMPEEVYWFEEPMMTATVEEDYYFPSSDMMVPLVPNSVVQHQQQQQQQCSNANKMYDFATTSSFGDEVTHGQSESSDNAACASKVRCTAAEMPSFSDEVPMVLEP
ncbi:hypothetical protein ABL78_8160 [Leptomonas seymouri]|uniref:C3H1-type domain-containing protein n=1 Tax=Leptomonas seymouri TaxID=5684 RepID=A0A0N0P2D6_LEPSE|nr:hypothetical protein ABL78_8160 [Leptomonas seymouri]|eukprot:KPI82829.1 hypothetical protein ABL78_8160 [Leptomonas seymouri]